MSSILVAPVMVERDSFSAPVEVLERLAAVILALACAPLMMGIVAMTIALSGRSPLIAHRRVGRCGSELWVLKFRTMWTKRGRRTSLRKLFSIERIDDQAGPEMKSHDDARVVSRFAQFCRRHSLDELPQLFHVLSGQMSLVGPRPVTHGELDRIYGHRQSEVLRVKPGLAGLWQVSGRNRLRLEVRRELDLECARSRSAGFYFSILMRTIPEVFNGRNTW